MDGLPYSAAFCPDSLLTQPWPRPPARRRVDYETIVNDELVQTLAQRAILRP